MIAQIWKGWTSSHNADGYEHFTRTDILPALKSIEGSCGAYILRKDLGSEVEFCVITLFESLDAVRAFAGGDYSVPVIELEARRLLSRVEPIARHYEVRSAPHALN